MTTDRQAQLLADWLHQEPGSAAPDDLDADAVEAVYALRPDLAPVARVTIEDILAEVREGPFAEVDPAAIAALMTWLEAHPGAEPPPEADPDAVEAILSLRPDLAPAARVDMDDIFGAVTTGPFATPQTVAGPDLASTTAPVDLAAARTARTAAQQPAARRRHSPPRRRIPGWAIPGLGAVAVAALAVLFVVPNSREAMDAPTPFSASKRLADKQAVAQDEAQAPSNAAAPAKPAQLKAAREQQGPEAKDANRQTAGTEFYETEFYDEDELDQQLIPSAPRGGTATGSTSTTTRAMPAGQTGKEQAAADPSADTSGLRSGKQDMGALTGESSGIGDLKSATRNGASTRSADRSSADRSSADSSSADRSSADLDGLVSGGEDRNAQLRNERAPAEPSPEPNGGARWADEMAGGDVSGAPFDDADDASRSYQEQDAEDISAASGRKRKANEGLQRAPERESSSSGGGLFGGLSKKSEAPAAVVTQASPEAIEEAEALWDDEPAAAPAPPPADAEDGFFSTIDSTVESARAEVAQPTTTATPAASTPAVSAPTVSAPTVSAPAGSAEMADAAPKRRDNAVEVDEGMSLDQLRAAAFPLGGYPDPTAGRPDVAAAHAAAAQADSRGDDTGFVTALAPLLLHPTADVALDAGYRIARRQLALGQTSEALRTIDRALSRGGSKLQQARLLALQGQVHERRGANEEAANAYREALRVR